MGHGRGEVVAEEEGELLAVPPAALRREGDDGRRRRVRAALVVEHVEHGRVPRVVRERAARRAAARGLADELVVLAEGDVRELGELEERCRVDLAGASSPEECSAARGARA